MPENTCKVDRTTRRGNPFTVDLLSRELSVELFRDMVEGLFNPRKLAHLSNDKFQEVYAAREAWVRRLNYGTEVRAAARHQLKGKNLACWCKDVPCHADVLLEIANS